MTTSAKAVVGACALWQEGDGAAYLTLPAFDEMAGPGVGLAISTRLGGVSSGPYSALNLGLSTGDDSANVDQNWARLCAGLRLNPQAIVGMSQVHGARVVQVRQADLPNPTRGRVTFADTDALSTSLPGLALRALAADCVPIALYDPRRQVVAAVHAGWRGILAGVLPAAVQALLAEGSSPTDLIVALGPCIGPCHYEVGPDVALPFAHAFAPPASTVATSPDRPPVVRERHGRTYLDLLAALRWQLGDCGVPASHVVDSGLCTACHTDLLYSHRAERLTGRFALIIWLRA